MVTIRSERQKMCAQPVELYLTETASDRDSLARRPTPTHTTMRCKKVFTVQTIYAIASHKNRICSTLLEFLVFSFSIYTALFIPARSPSLLLWRPVHIPMQFRCRLFLQCECCVAPYMYTYYCRDAAGQIKLSASAGNNISSSSGSLNRNRPFRLLFNFFTLW